MDFITQLLEDLLSKEAGAFGFWHFMSAISFAYVGGVLSSLTPCIYPMLPITVSVVGGAGPLKRSWQEVFLRGTFYVAGMTVIYSFLGVIAGMTGKLFGSMTQSSGWYIGLGTLFTICALVMMDILPFDPQKIIEGFKRQWSGSKKSFPKNNTLEEGTTLVSAFLLGASSGFIAAPCTTPVLTVILGFIAKTQSVGMGFALMAGFSLGLGTLLLIVAGFTGAFQVLPRSGVWMQRIKVFSGLLMLIFAEYLIFRAGKLGGF